MAFLFKSRYLQIRKDEKKIALRVVLNNYDSSYQELLVKAGCKTLYLTRLHSIAKEMFKSIKGINPQFVSEIFHVSEHIYDTRGGVMLTQPKVNTSANGLNSLRYQGAKIWNSLPTELKECESEFEFKQLLQSWNGPKCSCMSCPLCNAPLV